MSNKVFFCTIYPLCFPHSFSTSRRPVLNDSTASSDEYQTAGSSESEAESESDQETPEPIIVNEPDVIRTRSGYVSHPLQRYGSELILL